MVDEDEYKTINKEPPIELKETLEITTEISKLMDRAKVMEEGYDEQNPEHEVESIVDVYSMMKEIDENKDKIDEMIKGIIGSMYNGVLLEETLSCRKGKIYPYRCRYDLHLERVLEHLKNRKKEVIQKIGLPKYQKIQMLDKIYHEKEGIDFSGYFENGIKINPITIWDNEVLKTIRVISMDGDKIKFKEGDERWRGVELASRTESILINHYLPEINNLLSEKREETKKVYKQLTDMIDKMKTYCARFLIAMEVTDDGN